MSTDFAALAGAVGASLREVRVCILLSREGLVLGSFPESEERRAVDAWAKLATLGEPERGFVSTGHETWVFCSRGSYSALALADPGSRPGVVLDRLEQLVAQADEGSERREGPRGPGPRAVTSRERPSATPDDPPARFRPQIRREAARRVAERAETPKAAGNPSEVPPQVKPSAEALKVTVRKDDDQREGGEKDPLDPFAFAQEFSGILSDPPEGRE